MARLGGKRAGTVIFDDLAFKLTPSERIVFGIIHRFSGYALGECRLKPTKIAEIAGVSRSTVYNVTKRLKSLGLIEVVTHTKNSGAKFNAFKVIKDTLGADQKMTAEVVETQELANLDQKKDDETSRLGNDVVNELFDFWLESMGDPITTRVKANRRAAWNLSRKHSKERLEQMIQLSRVAFFNDYAPHIADFVDLQSKWKQLELWSEKRAQAALMSKYEAMSIEDRVKFKEENPALAQIIDEKRKAI